jgi:hypothetical protein
MRKHSRREFINQVFAASIGSTALSHIGSAWIESNDGLAELCVIARKPGTLPNAVVDILTGQIGSLDFELPEQLGRVVVWSDIRAHRGFTRSIADILFAIHEYFGIKPVLGSSAAAHVGHSSGLSCSIEMLFNTFEPAYLSNWAPYSRCRSEFVWTDKSPLAGHNSFTAAPLYPHRRSRL